jgi:valyl-tRNA synthetase
VGQQALIPLIDRPIPIIADDYVDMEFGTGCLKVTPAHDPNDYEIGQRHGLPTLDILTPDGRIAESSPRYVGQDRFEARESILTDLQTAGALVKTETLMGRVGRSERTNAVIEPRLSLQWFVDMKRLAEPALKAVLEGEVKLLPERFVNTYRHWMENIRDWCISRQLWWGQQIPAYFYGPNPDDYVVALTRAEAWELARAKGYAGAEAELVQDPDVLDTWFSSWLWPITVFDGLEEPHNPDFTYYYPTQDLVTGPDILFFWVARMIMAGYAFTDRKPFTNVYLTGIIRDSQRRKLSKSLGNSPDVLELIDKYGADAVRMGLMMSSSAGNDILYDEALCETGRNFANKIWNALRLVDSLASRVVPGELNARENLAVQWLNTRIQAVADEMRQQLGSYNILEAARSIYKLIWDDFCSTYLELIKPGYGEPLSQAALAQTKAAFGLQMQLLHPFMPFLTEEVWQALAPRQPGQSVGLHLLPSFDEMPTHLLGGMAHALEVVSALRTFRAEKHISPKERLALTAKTPDAAWLAAFAPAICHLGGLASLAATHTQPADCQTLVVGTTELYVPHSAANVDVAAERAKLTEELAYQQGFLESVRKKLGNEKFVANAKPDVVANERKKETDALAKIAVLQEALAQLG